MFAFLSLFRGGGMVGVAYCRGYATLHRLPVICRPVGANANMNAYSRGYATLHRLPVV